MGINERFVETSTNIIKLVTNEVDFSKPQGNPKGWWFQIIFGDVLNWFHNNKLAPSWFIAIFFAVVLLINIIYTRIHKDKFKFSDNYPLLFLVIACIITSIILQVKFYS